MRRSLFPQLAVGVVALGALALWGPFRGYAPWNRTHAYSAWFSEVEGLYRGAEVLFQGYKIGTVARIERDMESTKGIFHATLELKEEWVTPGTNCVSLYAPTPLQPAVLHLEPCSALEFDQSETVGKDEIRSGPPQRVTQRILDRIDSFTKVTFSKDNLEQLEGVILATHEVAEKLKQAARDETLRKQLDSVLGDIAATAKEVRSAVGSTSASLSESRPQLEAVLLDLESMSDRMAVGLDPILHNLEETSRNLATLSRDLRRGPWSPLWGRPAEDVPVPPTPGEAAR